MSTGRVTEQQWREVFRLRCRSKRGDMLTVEETKLCEAALKEDRWRYKDMDVDVFNQTAPFGAVTRKR